MQIIGLCGSSGSGKGTVSDIFLSYGIPSIDADAVYRDLTTPGSPLVCALKSFFGDAILNYDGTLNRKQLSKIVFEDRSGFFRKKLNEITHASIIDEAEKRISEFEKNGVNRVIFDAPLLFESNFDKKCDLIIAVIAQNELKVQRIMKRDNISEDIAVKRLETQLSDEELISRADFVIVNNGTFEELKASSSLLANKILNGETKQ